MHIRLLFFSCNNNIQTCSTVLKTSVIHFIMLYLSKIKSVSSNHRHENSITILAMFIKPSGSDLLYFFISLRPEIEAAVLLQENQQDSVFDKILRVSRVSSHIGAWYICRGRMSPRHSSFIQNKGDEGRPNIQAVGIPGIAFPAIPGPGNQQFPPTGPYNWKLNLHTVRAHQPPPS